MAVHIEYSIAGKLEKFQPAMKEIDGKWFLEWNHNPKWIALGYSPVPTTMYQWIRYHIGHGLLMQYPLWSVITWTTKWCIRNYRDVRISNN